MKKQLKFISLFLLTLLIIIPGTALAQCDPTKSTGCVFGDYVTSVIKWLSITGGSLALLVTIFAGYKYMTSQGEPKAIEEAKNMIVGVVVGVMLLFTAGTIISFLQTENINVNPEDVPTTTTRPATGTGPVTNPPSFSTPPATGTGPVTNPPSFSTPPANGTGPIINSPTLPPSFAPLTDIIPQDVPAVGSIPTDPVE